MVIERLSQSASFEYCGKAVLKHRTPNASRGSTAFGDADSSWIAKEPTLHCGVPRFKLAQYIYD